MAEEPPDEECRHGLDPRWCDLCKPKPPPAPAGKPRFRRGADLESMTEMGKLAEFDGWCDLCGDHIDAGLSFIRYEDRLPGWVHTWC